MPDYDAIVVGLGAMGSAAAYHLARRGRRVLGFDAFDPGHTLGSSHGETRIIRMAYFEHPAYVPLLQRAWQLWEQLEQEAATRLLDVTGGLFIGPPQGDLVSGSLRSARLHNLPHTVLDADEIRRRFPVFSARDHEQGIFEERAGILRPERSIQAHLDLAVAHGASLRHRQPVLSWTSLRGEVSVQTEHGHYSAEKLVVTAGAWAGKILPDLHLPLRPERIPLFWFAPNRSPELFETDRMPVWIWQDAGYGDFFGTPHLEWPGVKVGQHHTANFVDVDQLDRDVSADDATPIRRFVERCLPCLGDQVESSTVCLYTNSPDNHFIVDRDPQTTNVAFAAGFSGHGFKFATVIGEILADLTTTGRATTDADFLRLSSSRFSGQ